MAVARQRQRQTWWGLAGRKPPCAERVLRLGRGNEEVSLLVRKAIWVEGKWFERWSGGNWAAGQPDVRKQDGKVPGGAIDALVQG